MKICPHCKMEHRGGRSFGAHITNCKMNPKREEKLKKISNAHKLKRFTYKFNCKKCGKEYQVVITENDFIKGNYKKYCNRQCANSHIRTEESKLKTSIIFREKRENKPKYFCKNCGKQLRRKGKYQLCRKCLGTSLEYRKKVSEGSKNNGGYREKGGRGKQGWYNGFYCNSSWELAYVIYCLDNNISIKRNKQGFEYIFENHIFHYYPDFIKEDNSYVEIKGYKNEKYDAKISQFNGKLEIIDKKDIKPYLSYVITKYGEQFINLYEK